MNIAGWEKGKVNPESDGVLLSDTAGGPDKQSTV